MASPITNPETNSSCAERLNVILTMVVTGDNLLPLVVTTV